MDARCPAPEPGACLLARLDYGFHGPDSAGWLEGDLTVRPPWRLLEESPRTGLILREADLLLGWARTRSHGDLWERLAARARKGGLALQCRFPRRAGDLRRCLGGLGSRLRVWETPVDGRVPPLYEELAGRPDLLRLHLRHEWLTGIGEARGGAALWGAAFCLAAGEPVAAADLGRALGVTSGAARSYLTWMEDAALVRRAEGGFALRHPLLKTLFEPGGAPGASAPPAAPARVRERREEERPNLAPQPRWNPEEID